ncbi:MAG TPA: hypothetical protein VMK53_03370 [Gemmatimonadales bacterium]|nr:hypothetical protein [Gemmatimonadales bacterium]
MSIGPLMTLLVAAALVIWLVGRLSSPRRPPRPGDVDLEELEEAEREVRDLGTTVRPDEEVPGSDWGPGTPRPPTRL